jgi:hypothetical protein
MPVTYTIDVARRVIRTTCARPLIFAEVIEHFRTLRVDPACSGCLDVLLNVSEADALPGSGQFGAVTDSIKAIREKVQFRFCAVVATRDAMFGMMRMFEAFASPYFREMRVFRAAEEAEAWLASEQAGLDPEL